MEKVFRHMLDVLINYTRITLTRHRDKQVRAVEFYDVAMSTTWY